MQAEGGPQLKQQTKKRVVAAALRIDLSIRRGAALTTKTSWMDVMSQGEFMTQGKRQKHRKALDAAITYGCHESRGRRRARPATSVNWSIGAFVAKTRSSHEPPKRPWPIVGTREDMNVHARGRGRDTMFV